MTELIPKVVKRIIELQRAGKSFSKKFNIFGDDLTLYKKGVHHLKRLIHIQW